MLPTVPSSSALAFEARDEATLVDRKRPLNCLTVEVRNGIRRQMSEVSTTCSEDGESVAPHTQPKSLRWGSGSTVDFDVVDTPALISRPFDPFHRTASERRLCGGLVADDCPDSPLLPGAWPPRATAALALEAFGRILDENEHLRQSANEDPGQGFVVSSPKERTESTTFNNGERSDANNGEHSDANTGERSDCVCSHGTSVADHLPCEPLCGDCVCLQDSGWADDTDSKPVTDSYSFLRNLFWGTTPAIKLESKLPAPPDSTSSVEWTSSLAGAPPTHIQGAIVMSGSIEERPGDICQALRQALSDVLAHLSPTKITISCAWARVESEMTDNGIQIRCH